MYDCPVYNKGVLGTSKLIDSLFSLPVDSGITNTPSISLGRIVVTTSATAKTSEINLPKDFHRKRMIIQNRGDDYIYFNFGQDSDTNGYEIAPHGEKDFTNILGIVTESVHSYALGVSQKIVFFIGK